MRPCVVLSLLRVLRLILDYLSNNTSHENMGCGESDPVGSRSCGVRIRLANFLRFFVLTVSPSSVYSRYSFL
jgi:hypothetical protein